MAPMTPPSPQVVVPIVAMRAGTDYQTYVDLLVPGQAKISLLQVRTCGDCLAKPRLVISG